jgi:hypothetical protein
MKTQIEKRLAIFEREITALLKSLKGEIGDDYRATDGPDDNQPGMCVTVATDDNAESWVYQTGDNSYSGACYHKPHWAVIYLYRRSKSAELAADAIRDLGEAINSAAESKAWHEKQAAAGQPSVA